MNKIRKIYLIIGIMGFLFFFLGISFSIFQLEKIGKNGKLVLGDIYVHYKETTNSINISDMMPISTIKLNTSSEATNECVNYLFKTYGSEWNGLVYEELEKTNNESVNIDNSYKNYCLGYKIKDSKLSILNDYKNNLLKHDDKKYFLENNIIIDNIKNLDYFEFFITGKNTHQKGNVLYNIQLVEGDELGVENDNNVYNRIDAKYLRFRLTQIIENEEIILKDNVQYESLTDALVYSDIISKNTINEINKTYRLYMWIDENTTIGNGSDAAYSTDEWNKLYASVKVNVNGNYSQGESLTEKIKSKLGTDGLIAIDTQGNLYNGTGTIREYRYSGIGNYCTYTDGENDYKLGVEGDTCPQTICSIVSDDYHDIINIDNEVFSFYNQNCKDFNGNELPLKDKGSLPSDSSVKNYVYYNNELWRIIGVFGDNVKIIKDTPLENGSYNESTYSSEDIIYNIKYKVENTKYGYYYFNYINDIYTNNVNDWTNSGIMHYLNDETKNSYYTKSLSDEAKDMIEIDTYYLGAVGSDLGSVKEVYADERDESTVYTGNKLSWTGKIGLLYMSDYWYSTDSSNWNTSYWKDMSGFRSSWIGNTEAATFWFLTPKNDSSLYVWYWYAYGAASHYEFLNFSTIRPVLSLKSTINTIIGDGSYNNPYRLTLS